MQPNESDTAPERRGGKRQRRVRRYWIIAAALPLFAVGLWALGGMLMTASVEEPRYAVIERDGKFEVREYEPYVQARTTVGAEFKRGLNEGFRRLAGFIFGGNAAEESISMTAPVSRVQTPDGPVVTFAMPPGRELSDLPEPQDDRVQLVGVPGEKVAARRFSGWVSAEVAAGRTRELRDWMTGRGLAEKGPAVVAQYNPPWTLPWLRRNEILVPVDR